MVRRENKRRKENQCPHTRRSSKGKKFNAGQGSSKKKTNLKFLGPCDRLRQTEEGEKFWQKMMANKKSVSENEFLNNVNIEDVLDEGETWEEYKDVAKKQGDPVKLYKSTNGVYFFQTAGFEFIWQSN